MGESGIPENYTSLSLLPLCLSNQNTLLCLLDGQKMGQFDWGSQLEQHSVPREVHMA